MRRAGWRWLVVAAAVVSGASRPAGAAASCTISTAGGVAFGTYDVESTTPLDSTGLLRLDCNGAAKTVTVDLGRGNAPTFSPRFMRNGSSQLEYNLFIDATRLSIWGDSTAGTSHYGVVNPPNVIDLTIYGRIPTLQDLPVGSYTDTVVVTVNF
jgi:spore coat protein U domain-containing protein, fimbrial subunit CupE1/2/3/6